MNGPYLLDTNTVSYIAKGKSPAARARLMALENRHAACISAITEAELRYGSARRPEATALHAAIQSVLAKLRILPWASKEAAAYGSLRAKLELAGIVLSALDLQIAAHAVATGAVLVTSDKAFSQVADLHGIENWATDL